MASFQHFFPDRLERHQLSRSSSDGSSAAKPQRGPSKATLRLAPNLSRKTIEPQGGHTDRRGGVLEGLGIGIDELLDGGEGLLARAFLQHGVGPAWAPLLSHGPGCSNGSEGSASLMASKVVVSQPT